MAARIGVHDALVAALRAAEIEAKEEDTGGGCLAVVAPLPEGGEAVMAWECGEWGVSLSNAEGGCEWIGSCPTTAAMVGWIFQHTGRAAGSATS